MASSHQGLYFTFMVMALIECLLQMRVPWTKKEAHLPA